VQVFEIENPRRQVLPFFPDRITAETVDQQQHTNQSSKPASTTWLILAKFAGVSGGCPSSNPLTGIQTDVSGWRTTC